MGRIKNNIFAENKQQQFNVETETSRNFQGGKLLILMKFPNQVSATKRAYEITSHYM